VDFLPNLLKNNQSREETMTFLKMKFEQGLTDSVDRYWELPQLMTLSPEDPYKDLLVEARELFVAGHFYSCVAMCGIVRERLVKDMFRASVLIHRNELTEQPTDEAFDQLERVEISGIVEFLRKTRILTEEAANAAKKLGGLRNDYAHARGNTPEKDANSAIKLLHTLVEGTVSIFKDYEIKDGRFVSKLASPTISLE
jgi:hypothetical protein